jgi:hypothetical protein
LLRTSSMDSLRRPTAPASAGMTILDFQVYLFMRQLLITNTQPRHIAVPGLTVSLSDYFGCVLRERDVVPALSCDAAEVSLFTASLFSCVSVLALLSPLLTRTVSAGVVLRFADFASTATGAAASVDVATGVVLRRECDVVSVACGATVASVEPAVTLCGRSVSDRRASEVVPLDTGAAVSVLRGVEVELPAGVPVDVFRESVVASRRDREEEELAGVVAVADGDSETVTLPGRVATVSVVGTPERAGRRGCSVETVVVVIGPVTGTESVLRSAFRGWLST